MKNKKLVLSFFVLTIASAGQAQTLNDAIRLTDDEQYDAATIAFQNRLVAEPSNGSVYFYFGENYLLSDKTDSAIMMFSKGKQVDPNNVLNTIGQAKYTLNKTGDAKAILAEATALIDEALLKAGPKNSLALIESADALIKFKNKNLDRAKSLLDKAVVMDPKNTEIQILYGDIYSELNNGTLAAEYYNKALDLDKNSVKAIVSKGRLYKRSTNNLGAAEEFQNAIRIDSTFAPAHRELGEVSFKLGKLEKAKSEYKKYLDLSKNNCGARRRYASFLYLSKDYAGALNEINQLKQNCDPDNLTLLRVSSYCYYETKDCVKGLEVVQKLFSKITPEKTIALDYEYYGKLLSCNSQDSLAVIKLRKAYELDSSRTDLLSQIADLFYKMKKWPEAISTYIEKINNGKDVKVADYFSLGRSYLYNREFTKADSAFMKVNELAPKYASGYYNRAKANTYIDTTFQPNTAKPNYEKYIEIATVDTSGMASGKYKATLIEAYRYLAAYYVHSEAKDYGKAKEYLQKILLLDPEDKDAIEGIRSLDEQKKNPKQK